MEPQCATFFRTGPRPTKNYQLVTVFGDGIRTRDLHTPTLQSHPFGLRHNEDKEALDCHAHWAPSLRGSRDLRLSQTLGSTVESSNVLLIMGDFENETQKPACMVGQRRVSCDGCIKESGFCRSAGASEGELHITHRSFIKSRPVAEKYM